jgi:hypothetical protein
VKSEKYPSSIPVFPVDFALRKAIALWSAAAYILCENFLKVVASGRIK